jgi:hypothetical protein
MTQPDRHIDIPQGVSHSGMLLSPGLTLMNFTNP